MKTINAMASALAFAALASFSAPALNAGASIEDWVERESMLIFDLPNPFEESSPTMWFASASGDRNRITLGSVNTIAISCNGNANACQ